MKSGSYFAIDPLELRKLCELCLERIEERREEKRQAYLEKLRKKWYNRLRASWIKRPLTKEELLESDSECCCFGYESIDTYWDQYEKLAEKLILAADASNVMVIYITVEDYDRITGW